MYNPFSLENKLIVVTGASSGIGRQCAIDCSKMGATVVLIARNEERLKETLAEMDESHKHLYYSIDLEKIVDLSDYVKNIVAKKGKINGIIHCAGISSVTLLKMITENDFHTFFQINVFAALNLTKEICRLGNYSKDGCSIIFMSSIMGIVGEKGKTLYSATKGALISATRSLASELAVKNIRVNSISPGAIITPINRTQPYMADSEKRAVLENKHLLGLGNVTDISNACIFLLSDASHWITGQNIVVDGGYTAV